MFLRRLTISSGKESKYSDFFTTLDALVEVESSSEMSRSSCSFSLNRIDFAVLVKSSMFRTVLRHPPVPPV